VLEATLYTDPGCPWAYSANPALRVLEWRYREQFTWRLVMIGLREEASEAAVSSFDPQRSLARWRVFEERYGMPFGSVPKRRPSGTGRGCRAVVAAGLVEPGTEWTALRALQLAYFTTDLLLDDAESIQAALAGTSLDASRIVELVDDDEVVAEYERQLAEARSAAGTPADVQGKTALAEGRPRFTAPSVVFRRNGDSVVVAGGWQPLLAYDVLLANFEPELERTPPPESPEPLLEYFQDGLTTAEVALLLADGPDPVPDIEVAELLLARLAEDGSVVRESVGAGSIWRADPVPMGSSADRAET
jgi:protein-disulfide isomerase-like protein with CxxC motif